MGVVQVISIYDHEGSLKNGQLLLPADDAAFVVVAALGCRGSTVNAVGGGAGESRWGIAQNARGDFAYAQEAEAPQFPIGLNHVGHFFYCDPIDTACAAADLPRTLYRNNRSAALDAALQQYRAWGFTSAGYSPVGQFRERLPYYQHAPRRYKSDDVPLEQAVRGGASAVIRLGGVPIVLPAAPRTNCIELLAARELQSELAALSGLPPAPLLHEPQPPTATARIYVGRTAARLARLAHLSPLLPEEAAVVGDGAALFVFGDDVGAPNATNASVCDALVKARSESLGCNAGSFYAATLLLREHLGMRWVWPGADGIVRPAVADPHLNVSADILSRSAPLLALRRIRRQHPANPEYLSGWLNTSVVADYALRKNSG